MQQKINFTFIDNYITYKKIMNIQFNTNMKHRDV